MRRRPPYWPGLSVLQVETIPEPVNIKTGWDSSSLVKPSLGTEELADHRVHFHGLFLLNLLVGTQDDTDGQEQTRTRRISHRTQQVSTGSEQPDKRTGEVAFSDVTGGM